MYVWNIIYDVTAGKEDTLTPEEAATVEDFLLPPPTGDSVPTVVDVNLPMGERIQREHEEKMKLLSSTRATKYMDMTIICPTSNDAERLFSGCKLCMDPLRTCMTPRNYEAQVFLRVNRAYWSEETIRRILMKRKRAKEQRKAERLAADAHATEQPLGSQATTSSSATTSSFASSSSGARSSSATTPSSGARSSSGKRSYIYISMDSDEEGSDDDLAWHWW